MHVSLRVKMLYVSLYYGFIFSYSSLSKHTPLLCGSKREEPLGTSAKFLDYGKETQKQKQNKLILLVFFLQWWGYFILREFKNKPYSSLCYVYIYADLIGVEGCQGNSYDPK